jgi:hypothetical protein
MRDAFFYRIYFNLMGYIWQVGKWCLGGRMQVLLLPRKAYFWATHRRTRLDFFSVYKRPACRRPRLTPSMRIALQDLKLDSLYVVYPGLHLYKLADKVEAVRLWAVLPKAAI